jgi:N-acetylglucosamine kinase-like BadF-type ATPase
MKSGERILGVEGGGTKTAWMLVEAVTSSGDAGIEFRILDQGKLPPSNLRLTTPELGERRRCSDGPCTKRCDGLYST